MRWRRQLQAAGRRPPAVTGGDGPCALVAGLPRRLPAPGPDGLRRQQDGSFRHAGAVAGIGAAAIADSPLRQSRAAVSGIYRGMTVHDMLREAGHGAAAVAPDGTASSALRLPAYRKLLRDMAAALVDASDRAAELAEFRRAQALLIGPLHALQLRVADIHAHRPDLRPALQSWALALADTLVERALQPERRHPVAPELEIPLAAQIAVLDTGAAGTLAHFDRRLDAFFQDLVRPASTLVEGASGDPARGGAWLPRGQLWLRCSEQALPEVLFLVPAGSLQRQRTAADLLPGCSTGKTYRTAYPPASGIDRIKWYDPQGWIRTVLVTLAPGGGHRFSTDAGRSWRPTRGSEVPGMQARRIAHWGRFLADRRQGAARPRRPVLSPAGAS